MSSQEPDPSDTEDDIEKLADDDFVLYHSTPIGKEMGMKTRTRTEVGTRMRVETIPLFEADPLSNLELHQAPAALPVNLAGLPGQQHHVLPTHRG